MFIAAWGMFTSLVFLVYWVRFLFVTKKGRFYYFYELIGSSVVGAILAIGYVCMDKLLS
jgi:hypothetical protein